MVRAAVLTFMALAGWSGCGGTLTPPDGGGGSGSRGGGSGGMLQPPTGAGGSGAAPDAGGSGGTSGDVMDCWQRLPAPPIPDTKCRYEIPAPPCDVVSRGRIGVFVDDVQIPQDATAGWNYADETLTAIEIHGPSCDALADGSASVVTIFFYVLL